MSSPQPGLTPLTSPFVAGGDLDHRRTTMIGVLALLAPSIVAVHQHGLTKLAGMAMAVGVALAWQLLFARLRRRAWSIDSILAALIFGVLVATSTPLWQQAMALSFGVVLGEQVFGGRGRNFLSPAVVGLVFLLFSFPAVLASQSGPALAIASLAGAALLLGNGLISWRVLVGIALGYAGLSLARFGPEGASGLIAASIGSGELLFIAVFAIADPVPAAATHAGRWIYGALAGVLVVVLGHADGSGDASRALIFAAFLAALFAPLIDHVVVLLHSLRHGRQND